MTRTVKNAKFPKKDRCVSVSNMLFDRHSLHGGPVAEVAIRFPPPRSGEGGGATDERSPTRIDLLELRQWGRLVHARGPWIESRPLFFRDDAAVYVSQTPRRGCCDGTSPSVAGCYKILAFGGGNHSDSSMEVVHGMIFPSSSSSLAYLNRGLGAPRGMEASFRSSRRNARLSELFSIVAYGARRVCFLGGGCLWSRKWGDGSISQPGDFASISVVKTRKDGTTAYFPYLEISDWIHDVRLLDVDSTLLRKTGQNIEECDLETKTQKLSVTPFMAMLMCVGMANNNCEIWGLHLIAKEGGKSLALSPTRLQRIDCEIRCMTYSLSLYGWINEAGSDTYTCSSCSDDNVDGVITNALPSVVAASGTVFGEIIVWGVVSALDNEDTFKMEHDNHLPTIIKRWQGLRSTDVEHDDGHVSLPRRIETSRVRARPLYRLKGHLGSVFAVKFGANGNYIASTSDDRTVRLWVLSPENQLSEGDASQEEINRIGCKGSARKILKLNSSHTYALSWTGWGHTARVWDVSFASWSHDHLESSFRRSILLVSAGEDGVARLWSPSLSKKEIAHPLRGHRCESLWTVSVCEGIVVTGGNDGCVKLFDLESRVKSRGVSVRTFTVPKDPHLSSTANVKGSAAADQRALKSGKDKANAHCSAKSCKRKRRKAKPRGQAICGMEFYGSGGKAPSKLLVATRAGGLFSLDFANNIWTDHSSWSEEFVQAPGNEITVCIDPSTGNCIGVHPSGVFAIVGTTEGWLVVSSLTDQCVLKNHHQKNSGPAQSISFINNLSMLVFFRGSVIWFNLDDHPNPLYSMTMGTTGIPLSFALDGANQAMYLGDARGNVAFYDLIPTSPSTNLTSKKAINRIPTSLLHKVHEKEHVTALTVMKSLGAIVSVGNDGCMVICRKDANQLQKMISIPIPKMTGIRHIWPSGDGVILGGFYGNDFVMMDSSNGYEFLRVSTGGRQRQQDIFSNISAKASTLRCPNKFGIAILTGQKNGCNSIDVHCSDLFENMVERSDKTCHKGKVQILYSIGPPVHSETINDLCWVQGCTKMYLLTGSNDCTIKLSEFKNNRFSSVMDLPALESCVRGVCSSHHHNSDSSLLVTCGGKLSMEFYVLEAESSWVSFLCSYRTKAKNIDKAKTIDHRMNTVRAIPLYPPKEKCHLVLSGDSDGKLHLCIVSEFPETVMPRRTIIGRILEGNMRPVICLELLRCFDHILAFVGTTDGEIAVWMLPGSMDAIGLGDIEQSLEGIVPTSPVHIFKAHQTGINALSVASSPFSSADACCVVICSVGDDQALSTCVLDFTDRSLDPKGSSSLIMQNASGSALKGVKLIWDNNLCRIYTTGKNGKLTLWHLDMNPDCKSVTYITSSSLGTEGCCVNCVQVNQANGTLCEVIAVGGEGVEVLSIDLNILRAANQLREANYLLITTGAGFSADSGLQTYEQQSTEYREMCNPSTLRDSPYNFQQYWLKFSQSYLETKPHKGYELLDNWCQGGKLKHLRRPHCEHNEQSQTLSSAWWVYSSNVDSHFRSLKSFGSSLLEIHGSAIEFKCASGIGYSSGNPRLGRKWAQWNEMMDPTKSCKHATLQMNENILSNTINSDEILTCRHCHQPMRPNVLMFHDTDNNVLQEISKNRQRYQYWENLVEEQVATKNKKLVILEMGCGINVPAVREESEEVFTDCANKMHAQNDACNGSVCLIRVNPKDAAIHINDKNSCKSISITTKAITALNRIDFLIEALDVCN